MCPAALPTSAPGKAEITKKNEPGVDSCWHIAALGFLAAFLVTVTMSNSTFFYVGFIEEFDVNRESASWPRSVITVLAQLSGLALATLQRRLSLFTIFLLGGLLSWAGIVASAFVPNMAWMTVTLGGIHGLGIGVTTMTLSILLAMYFEKYRGLASGLKYAGYSCGGLVFPKFLAYLTQEYGFRGMLLIYGGLTMHVSAIGLFVKEPPWMSLKTSEERTQNTNQEHSVQAKDILVNVKQLDKSSTTLATNQTRDLSSTMKAFLNPMAYIVLAVTVVADFTGSAYISTLADYVADKGFSIEDAESLVIYGSFSELIGRLFPPLIADRGCVRRSTLTMASFSLWGCSMMLMPHAKIHLHVIIVVLCAYLPFGCLQSMKSVLMADYIGVQWISTCFGLSGLISVPLSFGSPSIIGFFRDTQGSYDGLFRLLGGLHLLVSVLFLGVVCVERRFMTVWKPNGNTQKKKARDSKTPNTALTRK
ncbi:monocarboxylate transporter 2-like [Ixodes scapularis]|uniref:monocarboxylate transporter 2-like n=1 Tax=Ixodes scapularis TaxID=6945 RepID=UPI001A9E0D88|nr:monocarboxylate transporter 2-like [Ixodes scapularis]